MAITLKQASKLIGKTFSKNAVAMFREGSASMGHEYAMDTPIDSGAATANWHASINVQDLTNKKKLDKTITADQTKSDMVSDLRGLKDTDTVYIQNAVTGDDGGGYIIGLENGKSKQAPHGMFDINNNQAQIIFDRARKRL